MSAVSSKADEIVKSHTDELDLLRYMQDRDATFTEPIWMGWDHDRGESVPGGGVIAMRCIDIHYMSGRTFEQHAKFITDYTNHLSATLYKGVPLYYRVSGAWCIFVLTTKEHVPKVMEIEDSGAVRKFNQEHYQGWFVERPTMKPSRNL